MATNLDLTAFDYALKTLYDDGKVLEGVAKHNVAYGRFKKKMGWYGNGKIRYPMLYAPMTGRSNSFTHAKGNRNPSKGKQFEVSRKHDYAVGAIDTETYLASQGNAGAFMEAMKTEGDSALLALNRSLGIRMFGNGSGKIGTVDTPTASTTLTLENADDITNFEVGMELVFAADEASALRDSGESLTVSAIDRDAGTMTVSANVSTISGITDGDAIFVEGDYDSASDRNLVQGLAAWIPTTAPTSGDSVFGSDADRSADVSRLAGVRYSSTSNPGLSTEEAISLLASRIHRNGGWIADTAYMGTDRFREFLIGVSGRTEMIKDVQKLKNSDGKIVAEVGYNGARVHAGPATIDVFSDANCPEDKIYVLTNDVWEFRSMGNCPQWLVKGRHMEDYDMIEFRLAYWGNLICKAAGANGVYSF